MKKNDKKYFDKENYIITILFVVIALILLGLSLYKIISSKDLNAASLETTILFIVSIVYIIYKSIRDKNFNVTSLKGEKLPTSGKKKDKIKRIKNYLIESLVFSLIVVFLDLIAILFSKNRTNIFTFNNVSNTINIVFNSLITFGICMIMSFGFEYIIGELQSKKQERKAKQ